MGLFGRFFIFSSAPALGIGGNDEKEPGATEFRVPGGWHDRHEDARTKRKHPALRLTHNPAGQITLHEQSNNAFAWTDHYVGTRAYTANGLNQYSTSGGLGITYDANGNLTSDGLTTYSYDGENRITGASGALNSTVAYDPLGRLSQVTSATNKQLIWDGDALVAEYDVPTGALERRYVHGPNVDEPLIWYEGTDRRYLFANHQGSIIMVGDASGVLAINTYDEYGIPKMAGNLGRFSYTGQIRIPQLGLMYYKARMYSPTLGRFMQTDPVGYDDQINLYAYVGNDPVNKTDPSGKWIVAVIRGAQMAAAQCAKNASCRNAAAAVATTAVQAAERISDAVLSEATPNQPEAPPVPTGPVGTPPNTQGKGGQNAKWAVASGSRWQRRRR